jgi:hypothetical protein
LLAKNKMLSEHEAKAITKDHFRDYYISIKTGKLKFVRFDGRFGQIKSHADKFKKLDLVSYQISETNFARNYRLILKLQKRVRKLIPYPG